MVDCLFNICLSVSFVCLFLLLLCLLFVFILFYKVCKDTKQRTSPFSEVLARSVLSPLSSTWLTISGLSSALRPLFYVRSWIKLIQILQTCQNHPFHISLYPFPYLLSLSVLKQSIQSIISHS